MKHCLAAVAAAPLLLACTSAGALDATEAEDPQTRMLIINGEPIRLDDRRDAASAIEQALAARDGRGRLVMEFNTGPADAWDAERRTAFAAAMSDLVEAVQSQVHGDFDFDFDGDLAAWAEDEGRRLDVMVRRIERQADRHQAHIERQAERMARRIERHAARAELHGLRAGVAGMEEGLNSIDEVLERGWYDNPSDGERERVALTEARRAELERTRTELQDGLERLRADLAQAQARHAGDGDREVRIVRRDGQARGWVDGEEATGSDLDRLLEGAPDAPERPETPRKQ